MGIEELLRRTRRAGYSVSDSKNSRGDRIISITSPDGSVWSRSVFYADDNAEVRGMREDLLRARCENYIKNPYTIKIYPGRVKSRPSKNSPRSAKNSR